MSHHPPFGAAPGHVSYPTSPAYGMPAPPHGYGFAAMAQVGAPIWQSGPYLCFRRDAHLGDVCPKTSTRTPARATFRFSWVPRWTMALLLLSPLIYVIVALVLQKKAQVDVPLAPQLVARRKLRWIMPIAGVVFLVVACALGGMIQGDALPLAIVVGMLGLLGGVIASLLGQPFRTHLVTRDFVVVTGAHPDYLRQLPFGPVPVPD